MRAILLFSFVVVVFSAETRIKVGSKTWAYSIVTNEGKNIRKEYVDDKGVSHGTFTFVNTENQTKQLQYKFDTNAEEPDISFTVVNLNPENTDNQENQANKEAFAEIKDNSMTVSEPNYESIDGNTDFSGHVTLKVGKNVYLINFVTGDKTATREEAYDEFGMIYGKYVYYNESRQSKVMVNYKFNSTGSDPTFEVSVFTKNVRAGETEQSANSYYDPNRVSRRVLLPTRQVANSMPSVTIQGSNPPHNIITPMQGNWYYRVHGSSVGHDVNISDEMVKYKDGDNTKLFYNIFYELTTFKDNASVKITDHLYVCKSHWFLGKMSHSNYYFLMNEMQTINFIEFFQAHDQDYYDLRTEDTSLTDSIDWLTTRDIYETCEIMHRESSEIRPYLFAYFFKLSSEYKIKDESLELKLPFDDSFDNYLKKNSKPVKFANVGNYNNTSSATITETYTAKKSITETLSIEISNQSSRSVLTEDEQITESTLSYKEVNDKIRAKVTSKLGIGIASTEATLESEHNVRRTNSNGRQIECMGGCMSEESEKQLKDTNRTTISRQIEYTLTKQIEIKPFTHLRIVSFMNWAENVIITVEIKRNVTVFGPVMPAENQTWVNVENQYLNEPTLLKFLKFKYSCDTSFGLALIRGSFAVGSSFTAVSDELKEEKGIGMLFISLIVLGIILISSLIIVVNYYLIMKLRKQSNENQLSHLA